MYLPMRDASVADLLSNAAGAAAGGAVAVAFARSSSAKRAIVEARDRWFLPGTVGDLGLALLAIWLVVQVNPGIPLFATMYDLAPPTGEPPAAPDVAATLVEGAHSAFQLLGVGLFLALLLRERRYVGGAALLLVGAAALVKGIAAAVMLKPAAWENWLAPGVSLGVAAGSLLLSVAIWLPRPVQVTLAAIALLSSLLATLFAPDLCLRARADRALQQPLRASAQLQRSHAHRAAALAGGRERVPAGARGTPRLGRAGVTSLLTRRRATEA